MDATYWNVNVNGKISDLFCKSFVHAMNRRESRAKKDTKILEIFERGRVWSALARQGRARSYLLKKINASQAEADESIF